MIPRHVAILNWKDGAHPAAGGAEAYCANVARELALAGVEVTFVASRPRGTRRQEHHDGYQIRRMGRTFSVYPLVLLWLLVHRRRIDAVIDSQNGIPFFSPLVTARSTAVVLLIHHVHQDQFGLYFRAPIAAVGRFMEGWMTRRVYRKAVVCTVSPSARTEIRQRLGLRGPVFITPNGYRAGLPSSEPRAALPTITCVGRLVPHKRWDLLVDAVGRLAGRGVTVEVELIGDGSERSRLQAQILRLGLSDRVTVHGSVTDQRRDELLARSWLSVSTSIGEGWGLSVIEAAAYGVPTVAIDVPGLRDSVIDGTTGWLTAAEDLDTAIAQAILYVADADRAHDMSAACRAWAHSLHWSATSDRFLAVLSDQRQQSILRTERRGARSDIAVMVTLGRAAARMVDPRALRATDQMNYCADCIDTVDGPYRIVLGGADERDARVVLDRLGVSLQEETGPSAATPVAGALLDDAGVDIRLCRARDGVQWHAGLMPHNAPTLLTHGNCPARRQRMTSRLGVVDRVA